MSNFFKDSFAELEHVVWPTHAETQKFLKAVLGIIAGMTLFTYLLTVIFSNTIFGLRSFIHRVPNADLSGSPTVSTDGVQINAEPVNVQATPEVPVKK